MFAVFLHNLGKFFKKIGGGNQKQGHSFNCIQNLLFNFRERRKQEEQLTSFTLLFCQLQNIVKKRRKEINVTINLFFHYGQNFAIIARKRVFADNNFLTKFMKVFELNFGNFIKIFTMQEQIILLCVLLDFVDTILILNKFKDMLVWKIWIKKETFNCWPNP